MYCESSVGTRSARIKSYVERPYLFFSMVTNHGIFCASSFDMCFEYKAITVSKALFGEKKKDNIKFDCVQIPEILWHNRHYYVKFQFHLCTLSLHICTVCVGMRTFCTLSVTLSRHVKGRSHTGCPGPALFNIFTTTSMDSGKESILIKYCLSKSGRTAEFQRLRTEFKMHLTHWKNDVKSAVRNSERQIHRGKRNQWCKQKMWKSWLNSSSAEDYPRLHLVTVSPWVQTMAMLQSRHTNPYPIY